MSPLVKVSFIKLIYIYITVVSTAMRRITQEHVSRLGSYFDVK